MNTLLYGGWKKEMPPPGIEPGFHRPQRCVITPILRWRAFLMAGSGVGTCANRRVIRSFF